MTLGVVVPCHRQEERLPRTLAAVELALTGHAWRGAVVLGGRADPRAPLPVTTMPWQVLAPPRGLAGTPGAARMLGFAAVPGEWVLFVDADTEVDVDWVKRALAATETGERVAGYGGRIEERVTDGARDWAGDPDLNRVGDHERDVALITTPALYRRGALLEVGGYDPRLGAEEDFELGWRLARAGWRLRLLAGPAGRHWNAPRPSLAEVRRRWEFGLTFGPGEALRLYVGRPGFAALLARQRLPLALLAWWLLGLVTAALALLGNGRRPLATWLAGTLAMVAAVAVRKHGLRLALHGLLAWSANGLGLVVGFVRPPRRVVAEERG
ncbi:MAG: glycosyltransferase family 2 protein [Candidatus Eisenbacteria bacterium]